MSCLCSIVELIVYTCQLYACKRRLHICDMVVHTGNLHTFARGIVQVHSRHIRTQQFYTSARSRCTLRSLLRSDCMQTTHPQSICTSESLFVPSIHLLPSHLLLQRLLPVLDVIRNNLGSLVSREITSDGLDEIAFWICLSSVSPKIPRCIHNITYPSNRSKCCDQPSSPDRAWYPWVC